MDHPKDIEDTPTLIGKIAKILSKTAKNSQKRWPSNSQEIAVKKPIDSQEDSQESKHV